MLTASHIRYMTALFWEQSLGLLAGQVVDGDLKAGHMGQVLDHLRPDLFRDGVELIPQVVDGPLRLGALQEAGAFRKYAEDSTTTLFISEITRKAKRLIL